MDECRQPLFGDLFSGADMLDLAARRQLAVLLAVPGRPPPLLGGELSLAPLPPGAGEVEALIPLIEEGLGKEALARLGGRRLGEIVPAVAGRDGNILTASWPPRLRALLEQNNATTWKALGERTLADIGGWANAGPATVARLVGRAVEAGAMFLAEDGDDRTEPVCPAAPEAATATDVAFLLGHERAGGGHALRRAFERLAAGTGPPAVRAAAARVLGGPDGPTPPVHPALAPLDQLLAAAGDERDRTIFERLELAPHPPLTLAEMAAAFELSVERCRQLRSRAAGRVRELFAAAPAHLHREAEELAGLLGAAVPVAAVDEALAAAQLPPLPDSRSLLLLWLAGPYRGVAEDSGWVATRPADLVAETRRMIREDGGVCLADQLAKQLDILGVVPDHVGPWLGRQPVRRVDELVIDTSGAPGDVIERALSALGRSMTVVEMQTWVTFASPGDDSDRLWSLLLRDARFVQVAADAFELAEWGSERYDVLPGLFAGDGDRESRSWLRFEVDAELLASADKPVPASLVQLLALRRGASRTFTTRYGPVMVSNGATQPLRGSLRHVALAAGATLGDVLLIGFGAGRDDALVERLPAGSKEAS